MDDQVKEVIEELQNLDTNLVSFSEKIDEHSQWLDDNDSPLISQIGNLISTNRSFINFTDQENLDAWRERTTDKLKEMGVQFTYTELGPQPYLLGTRKTSSP